MDTNITTSISNFTGIEELQGVRSFTDEKGTPWFVLADICKILDIVSPWNIFAKLESWQKGLCITETLGGPQQMNVINEAGLYKLIGSSRKPAAKEFMKWLYGELLPKLRQKYNDIISGNGRQLIDVMTILPPWVVEENNRRLQQMELLKRQNQNLLQQNKQLLYNNQQLSQQVQGQQQYLNTQQDRVYDYRDMVKDSFNHIHNELNKLEYDLDHHRINYKSNLDYISDNIDEF